MAALALSIDRLRHCVLELEARPRLSRSSSTTRRSRPRRQPTGADVLPTTRTFRTGGIERRSARRHHVWLQHGGRDPYTCAGAACSVTIEADITPIVVTSPPHVDGDSVLVGDAGVSAIRAQ